MTIITPPWAHHPEQPTEMGTIIQTSGVPERIGVYEWTDADEHLREWKWIERDGLPWWWNAQLNMWESEYMASDMHRPLFGPWTRGGSVK